MPTYTSKGLIKPLVDNPIDEDLWGTQLNANSDKLETLLNNTTASKTADFNVLTTEFNYTYLIDALSAAVTATLPEVSTVYNGFVIRFKAIDVTNTITISAYTDETIDGLDSVTMEDTGGVIELVCDGTEWKTQIALSSPSIPISSMVGKILYGLELSNGTDATNDINIAVGSCISDDGTTVMNLSAITKCLDAAWAVGSGNGGLDTGSIANTTYHIWVINRPDTNVTDVLFSASASAPTMPTDYTKKKCIGSIVRASAAILPFVQYGNEFYLKIPVLDINDASTGTSANTGTLSSIPNGVALKAIFNAVVLDNNIHVYFSSLTMTDMAASRLVAPLANLGTNAISAASQVTVWTNTSRQIRYRLTVSSQLRIATLGWIDPRI